MQFLQFGQWRGWWAILATAYNDSWKLKIGNCVVFYGKDDDFDDNFSCKKNSVPVAGMAAVSNMKIVPTSTSASVCQGGTAPLLLK